MIQAQNIRYDIMAPAQLADNAALSGNTFVDTKGFSYLTALFTIGAIDIGLGSGDAATAITLEESDTSGGSYTEISGAVLSSAIGSDDDDSSFAINVNLLGKKRFIRVKAPTAGDGVAGVNVAIVALLTRAEEAPNTATKAGLAELIIA